MSKQRAKNLILAIILFIVVGVVTYLLAIIRYMDIETFCSLSNGS